MIYKVCALLSIVGTAAAGPSIELVSSDLSKGGRALDNVKGTWSQALKFLGNDAQINAEYDRSARSDFLSEATLSGKVDDVSYEVKTSFGNTHEVKLTADTKDGTTLELNADVGSGVDVRSVSATRDVKLQGQDCTLEASHERASGDSKLKLSSVLGHGVSGTATWLVGSKMQDTDVELEYAASVGDGRSVSASVNPKNGKGDVEYVDSKTIDATITAGMDLGGKPSLTVKRGWAF